MEKWRIQHFGPVTIYSDWFGQWTTTNNSGTFQVPEFCNHVVVYGAQNIGRISKVPIRQDKYYHAFKADPEVFIVDPDVVKTAMIHKPTGQIFFNRQFYLELTKLQRKFVILHELAHLYLHRRNIRNLPYMKEEKFCDAFAIRSLVRIGFNPSQSVDCREILHFSPDRSIAVIKEAVKL